MPTAEKMEFITRLIWWAILLYPVAYDLSKDPFK